MAMGLADLPNEIIVQILRQLPTGDIFYNCPRINRRFYALVKSEFPNKISHINITLSNDKIDQNKVLDGLQEFNNCDKPNIKALTVNGYLQHKNLELLVRMLQSLTTLKMLFLCIDIDDMDPNKDMTEEVQCLQSIWKHLAHLEVLSICTTVDRGGFFCSKEERFPHLRELYIEEHYDLDKIHLDPFVNLRLLSMYVYDLVDLGAFIREIDRCCPHLESLSLSFPGGQLPKRKSDGKPEVSGGSALLPNLKTFTLMTSNCDNEQILYLAKTLARHYPSFANGTWSETLKPFGWALEGVRYIKYQSNPMPDINVTRCNLLLHPTPDGLLKKLYGEKDAERYYLNGYPTTFVIDSPWNWLHHAFPNPWEELDLDDLKSTWSHLKQKLKSS